MKIHYHTLAFLSILILSACSKDLGNYEYHDINELDIQGVDQTYLMRTGIDTLRIAPIIDATMDESDISRYDYLWILRRATLVYDTISRQKDVEYPIKLDPATYDLFYRVVDREIGTTWVANTKITVSTSYSKGLLIIGEDEEGYVEAEMLSMLADTVHVKNILAGTELPRLREPVSFFHTSGTATYSRLWVMTKTGSYFLDRATLAATTANNFGRYVYMSDDIDPQTLQPIAVAPQIRTAAGAIGSTLYRAVITVGGDLFAVAPVLMGGDYYNNPANRTATDPDVRLTAAPYLMYPINSMSSFIWYDQENNRFLNFTNFVGNTSSVLPDNDETFPWNQPAGRTLVYAENTRNTDGGSTNGNSFAIMKDNDNTCHIYKFYANGTNPAKRAAYTIKPIATDFATADFYAFSSNRTVVFYAVGNKLYAYDYNPGHEKIYTFPEIGADEITMLKFDTQIDHLINSLYIATYNSTEKGTLKRYRVGMNPDIVELLPQENSTWSGMIKIKDINWRAIN